MTYLTPIIVLSLGVTLYLVGLAMKRIAAKGWGPLAAAYPLAQPPTGPQTRLSWVSVGGSGAVGHKSAVVAGASAAGLSLRMPLLGWLGHPPMLIPWSACGPFRAEKQLLSSNRYTTSVRLPNGAAVALRFEDNEFARAIRPWAHVEEGR